MRCAARVPPHRSVERRPRPQPRALRPAPLPQAGQSALDYTTHHVALSWIGADALGKTQLLRAVVHWPEPVAYSADLPGIVGLTDVFLAEAISARSASLYISTAEKDPFAEQLPAFVQTLFGPLSGTIGGILGGVTGGPAARLFAREATLANLAVTISGVVLPVARASIRLQMKARDLVRSEDFTNAVERLGTSLLFDGGGRSNPARTQIAKLVDDLPGVAATNCAATATSIPTPALCRKALDSLIKAACDAAMQGSSSNEDARVIEDVDEEFRALAVDA